MLIGDVKTIKAILFDLDGTLLPMDQEIFVREYNFKCIYADIAKLGQKWKTSSPSYDSSGYRYYSNEQLNQVMNIKPKICVLLLDIAGYLVTNKKMTLSARYIM